MESFFDKVHKKRQRSENWVDEDKHLLTELIRERVSVLENKNTDTNTNVKKQRAWKDLLNRFNNKCKGGKRTVAQLKCQWGIIKMNQKKMRKAINDTGCGSPPQGESDNSNDISAWLPNKQLENKVIRPAITARKKLKVLNKEYENKTTDDDDDDDDVDDDDNDQQTTTHVTNIANLEMKCRQELHNIQMENEKRKGRNLELEEILLRKKIEYYDKKIHTV